MRGASFADVGAVADGTVEVADCNVAMVDASGIGATEGTLVVAVVIDGDAKAVAGGEAYALNAGAAACCAASLVGRATAALLGVPADGAVASDLTCADALPIKIAPQSAAINTGFAA